jgi:DNA invertase Pin-like site-specific DNA recombinase/adenylate kinase family enzyme
VNELPTGARVVVYTRCSTPQQVNSIADQDADVMRIVERHKLKVVKTYSDEGISGSTIDERDALKNMLSEIGTLGVDIILVYNLSRLTRGGLKDLWALIGMFGEKDVRIYNCQSGQFIDEDNAGSALMACVEASQAKASNKDHARDITRTMIANVKDRKNSPGSRPPYGYDRLYIDEAGKPFQQVRWNSDGTKDVMEPETKKVVTTLSKSTSYAKAKTHRVQLVPSDPKRVAVAQEMFRLAATTGYTGVADFLNERNIPGPKGGLWNSSSIRDILLNPAYAGDVVFNRTHKGRYYRIEAGQAAAQKNSSGKVIFKDNPKDEWIVIPDAHESLISREAWEAVQLALEMRSKSSVKSGRGPNRDYPLSGIMVCGHCGAPMSGMCVGKRRYICSTRRKHGKGQCIPCSVDAEKVEKFVIDKIREELLAECVKASLREGLEQIYDGIRRTMDDVEAAQRDLDKLQKRKNDIFAKLTGDDLDLFRGQIDAMKGEEERLRKRLTTARAENGRKLDKKEFLQKCFDLYENQVLQLKGGCENAIRESLRALGTKIVYYPDGKDGTIEVNPFVHSAED